ncbi:hypothetical protein [Dyella koreensis]|uniref:Uncharacterized protein n=1 Tax=Dyella koreensis TaxID=311235 RepID=A0ABW8K974_9GAMM
MLKKILISALGLSALAAASIASAFDIYQMQLSISRANVVIAKPIIQMEANKIAELTVKPTQGFDDDAVRLQVSITEPDAGSSTKDFKVHMLIFDRSNGEWILRGEPDVQSTLNTEVTLTTGINGLKRIAAPLGVSFQLSRVTADKTTSALDIFHHPLKTETADLSAFPSSCNCCTAGNLQCCNAVSCCEGVSGVCCNPLCRRMTGDRHRPSEHERPGPRRSSVILG